MMKVAASSYSFSRAVADGRLTQFGTIAKAKEMGLDGIEFSGLEPTEGETRIDYAKRVREECERLGMPMVNFCTGADFLRAESVEAEIERIKGEVDIAAILGVPSMRHDATFAFKEGTRKWQGFDQILPILADACRQVTEYAASKGIRTCIENHGQLVQESRRVEKLINAVAHENFGQLIDIGNFTCVDEDCTVAVGRNAPYAVHVHAKDFHVKSGQYGNPGRGFFYTTRSGNHLRGAIIGHGDVPVRQCISILKANGYDGYVSIEFEGMEDPYDAIPIGMENLRRYIAE
ncbi:MAG: sugar phosphate isomerase/epimerase [Clostridia bacterium]|nr:sugar phosphate isomerase/epimerase [Clostridia bacterium]